MKTPSIVSIALLAAAGIGIFVLTRPAPDTKPPPANAGAITLTEIDAPGQCAYTWAYKDLPEISAEFQSEVQAVIPEAEAHATAYGEDCVYENGSATFSAMETDFYIIMPMNDLTDNETLATYIVQILPIVDGFSPPRVPGSNEGFVEFTFRNGEEQLMMRVPIPLGKLVRERGLHGTELIQALETK
jgi:hypothetical protein